MKKIDETVLKETKYIAAWIFIFSVLMQAVFLVISEWNYTVLLGNILSAVFSVLNFFLMGLTVQKALDKDEKEAKTLVKVSQLYRSLMILVVTVIGVALPCFNTVAVIVPVFFPRIAIAMRPLFDKK
ncbi:MAG: hypothetical protein J6C03_01095 [Clostridia bacterium]|nr:hypothetical protein [Clostridia bacterium]